MSKILSFELDDFRTEKQFDLIRDLGSSRAHRIINEVMLKYINEHVPYNSSPWASRVNRKAVGPGGLRKSAKVSANGITWTKRYANYVWYGENYGPHIPIHAKGDSRTIIGFFTTKTQVPNGTIMQYSTPETGGYWLKYVEPMMEGQSGRNINNEITRRLKAERKKG